MKAFFSAIKALGDIADTVALAVVVLPLIVLALKGIAVNNPLALPLILMVFDCTTSLDENS